MTLSAVRTGLAAAVTAALADTAWKVTDKIPLTPDDPSVWVRFPNDARRHTLADGLQYEINVTFCVGLNDTDVAQDALNDIYEPTLWGAIEAYATPPVPWAGLGVVRMDEPYPLTLADGSSMLAVDMVIDLYT